MSRTSRLLVTTAAALAAGALVLSAHVRLITGAGGPQLFWNSAFNIPVVISSTSSDDITDGSYETAIRNAIEAWNEDAMSFVNLAENTDPLQQARTDWSADDIHLVFFDENDTSGFFPGMSGTVAITPVSFFPNGLIADADVIYNGKDHNFTTTGTGGSFDVQDIAVHELGHLLGLDHSGWAGSTMFPWVDPSVILHRSLSQDDLNGMRDAYPQGTTGTFTGTVRRAADNSVVAGAHVIAVNSATGRTGGAALANSSGFFRMTGLPSGSYAFWAEPLDEPVSALNLTAGHTVHVDFSATAFGAQVVAAGQTIPLGDLLVNADATVQLGMPFNVLPVRVISDGMARAVTLNGVNIAPGAVLTCSDPSITLSAVVFTGTSVTFMVSAPIAHPPGHADLMVLDDAAQFSDVLPSALEITPPNPTVATVNPTMGPGAGGTALTITGTGFNAGARVVIGNQIYRDGAEATVVDPNTITLTTAATDNGTHDVVVIDATGVEGRMASGFQSVLQPTLNSVFPVAGDAAGGTSVRIKGAGFAAGVTVMIDGVNQATVTLVDSMTLDVTTDPGPAGGPYVLEVINTGGGMATSAFSYVAQPDPTVTMVSPTSGSGRREHARDDHGDELQRQLARVLRRQFGHRHGGHGRAHVHAGRPDDVDGGLARARHRFGLGHGHRRRDQPGRHPVRLLRLHGTHGRPRRVQQHRRSASGATRPARRRGGLLVARARGSRGPLPRPSRALPGTTPAPVLTSPLRDPLLGRAPARARPHLRALAPFWGPETAALAKRRARGAGVYSCARSALCPPSFSTSRSRASLGRKSTRSRAATC